jgi:hypothetical protein
MFGLVQRAAGVNAAGFVTGFVVCLFVVGSFMGSGPAQAAKDYLTSAQRAEVTQLQKDIAREPTTYATMKARGQILWRWSNAYSLTQRTADPNIPVVVGQSAGYSGRPDPKYSGIPVPDYLDMAVAELAMREKTADPYGTAVIDNRGPFEAGSFVTFKAIYTVGEKGLPSGSAIILGRHMMSDNVIMQADDPSKEGYVSAVSSNSAVTLTPERFNMTGSMGRAGYTPNPLAFRISGAALKAGDTVTLTYGDMSKGSPGMKVQSYSNDRIPFWLYLDLSGRKVPFFLSSISIAVQGSKVKGVHGFAPSIVATGESFELAVRSQDFMYNRATGPIPAYDLFVNGEKFRSIPASSEPITVLKDISFQTSGVYRITIASADGAVKGVANPILVESDPARRIYWGETHGHSGFAEGMGSTESYYTYGRDDARLDFLLHSDHDSLMDDFEWEETRRHAISFYEPGKFIPFLGWEYSTNLPMGGHHNVMFRTPEGRARKPIQEYPALTDFYHAMRAAYQPRDVVVIPHAHQPGDWRISDPQLEPLIEIMSGHGTFEWFGRLYLQNGYEIGFVAASDDHFSHPGYSAPWHEVVGMFQQGGLAAAIAPEKSRDAIFDALRAHRVYATNWERIIVDLKLNGADIGSRVKFSPARKMEGRVIGTGPLESITIYKNGEPVHEFDYITRTALTLPADKLSVEVGVESQSHPPGYARVFPRETRKWTGSIEIIGAELAKVSELGFNNPNLQAISLSPDNPRLVKFKTATRGRLSSIRLDLAKVTAGAKIKVHINESVSRDAQGVTAVDAKETTYPAQDFLVMLKDIAGGKKRIPVNAPKGYEDSVLVRLLKDDPVLETSFHFEESDAFRPGDYYYVRVRQHNGSMAWVSPVWVGGFPPR